MKGFQMVVIMISLFQLISCQESPVETGNGSKKVEPVDNVAFVGTRSSYYGFDPFPSPEQACGALKVSAKKFPGSTPSAIWIIGCIGGDARKKQGYCMLEFPRPENDQTDYQNITFAELDKHESYLSAFDTAGIKVFLQIEPGMANVETLITLILNRYKHHPSVAGVGIDIEWYPSPLDQKGKFVGEIEVWDSLSATATNESVAIAISQVEKLDLLVKSFNPSYRLFLKHWESEFCGGKPVSDVIYVDDSQDMKSLANLKDDFTDWGKTFYPNDVGFQFGYEPDQTWWGTMKDPFSEIGKSVSAALPKQNVSLYWVDFTAYSLKELWQ